MRGARALLSCWLACGACGHEAPQPKSKRLAEGVLAEVGSDRVARSTVERIAAAQSVAPRKALEHALSDALFANEAQSRLPRELSASLARAAQARMLLDGIARDAVAAGEPSDAELKAIVSERWNELDRPPSVRVSHAVALAKPEQKELREKARKLAEQIRSHVEGEREPPGFIRAAREVPHEGIQIVAERLPFICADGRAVSTDAQHAPEGDFDQQFAKAANQLREPGEHSPVVESAFGFHVILLESRLPEQRAAFADLRRSLGAEVLSRRAADARRKLIEQLRERTRVDVARDVEQATQKLVR
ncbi:MAG: peptidyl-prolyl cis-trans isomerase [Polyangiaceae bacterium]